MIKLQKLTQLAIFLIILTIIQFTFTGHSIANNAIQKTQQLAEQGNPEKQYDLALHYLKGKDVPRDLTKAVYWLHKSAVLGFAKAQYSLALRYIKGEGVPQNFDESSKWLKCAAKQNLPDAQFSLAMRYQLGQGVEKNENEQIFWLKKAAKNGHKEALFYLALVLSRRGDAEAQLHLGNLYYEGIGTTKNHTKAAYWYEKSALQGNPVAQYTYAIMLNAGDDQHKNSKQALEWFQKSANQGYAPAQLNLGAMYAMGTGVKRDMVTGYAWTYLAARRNNETAAKNCQAAAQEMTAQEVAAAIKLAGELQRSIAGGQPKPQTPPQAQAATQSAVEVKQNAPGNNKPDIVIINNDETDNPSAELNIKEEDIEDQTIQEQDITDNAKIPEPRRYRFID